MFDPADDLFNDLASTYDRVVLNQLDDAGHYSLLNREYNHRWRTRLGRIEEELGDQKLIAGRADVLVILDTSVLMEAKPLTQIDWHGLHPLLAGQPVRLVVPILVVLELDDLARPRRRQEAESPCG